MSDEKAKAALMWLANALGDLEAAEAQPRGWVPARTVAFHAQQAAEKALKAALVLSGGRTSKIHDLDVLRNRLPDDRLVKKRYPDLSRLTDYAVASRYPDTSGPTHEARSAEGENAGGRDRQGGSAGLRPSWVCRRKGSNRNEAR
jgi:HEPN domain-containing protein